MKAVVSSAAQRPELGEAQTMSQQSCLLQEQINEEQNQKLAITWACVATKWKTIP